jgi:hypothetical protein
VFLHHRPVPPRWQAELEAIVPRSTRVPWLQLVWQPGIEYQPVQRWEIYEMLPALRYVPAEIRDSLDGPCPRAWGEWLEHPPGSGRRAWISSSLVSLVQWQLYRATGCYPARFWILQGPRGGHKFKLSAAERNFLQAMLGTEEVDTPVSGTRPYAPWDRRVRAQIIAHDRLRRWKMTTPWDGRAVNHTQAGLWVKRDRLAEERHFAEAMLAYLESQIEDVVSDIPRRLLPGWSDLPDGDHYYNKDEDALDESLVSETASATIED